MPYIYIYVVYTIIFKVLYHSCSGGGNELSTSTYSNLSSILRKWMEPEEIDIYSSNMFEHHLHRVDITWLSVVML